MAGELRQNLSRYGIRAKKGLGQNFLSDPVYVGRIIAAAELAAGDVVVEIGPGPATLTRDLAEAVGPGGKVIAVEVDERLRPLLDDLCRDYPQVEILWQDALQVDYDAATQPWRGDKPFVLVANLPYYITTPILMRLLEGRFSVSRLVVMVQKEVADRMLAPAGHSDYGALSVVIQYYCAPSLVTKVPPGAFIPPPKVSSAVVRLDRRATPPVAVVDEAAFFRVVRAAFNQRRKTLLNALGALGLALNKEEMARRLTAAGVDPGRRGETLNLQEFANVADALYAEA
ncbi:dimethyladenosine transferase [Heliomicrobium modesticaldum Ice1]|uniref:Ribosomal RNA small subunit methyltransferase A n=1 Tax=Heliobacterium modesticaldum (strain ATCC 51547 / Ice1) TaxID=498761 RepID=B0TB84_HELMI|nr:16S rRNA (adenine(1518)-N(6)/adenine(1519)-N(6))-dimethyltransferase RsmA [Heliomicrobium modesticaldum]ABZ83811.1 dimethyladenosine transferase [Heliomicrobium modesticaldum Ice1]